MLRACSDRGLAIGDQWQNIVKLLKPETAVHGFRYFAFASLVRPEVTYLRDVAADLIAAVEREVEKRPSEADRSKFFKMTVCRPREQSKPPGDEG